MNIDEWVCIEDGEDDCVIERFEVRVKGKKPLVINNPTFSKLIFVTQQYLNCSLETTKELLRKTVLSSPEPLSIDDYIKLVEYLEKSERLKDANEK
ncbi:hypothetical protein V8073_004234 [Vibrio parahaemolyticus]|nr:hypothetical protein [Vibrio parahaemolyticus]EIT7131651.1 hypothetical protein [Vibrio parahaemolyticus]EIZ1368535.1 hypothetical protein [Vibrio parahaemolyticus]EIZ4252146.1 hypothetical protein [Vibrio parahaemolyticus]